MQHNTDAASPHPAALARYMSTTYNAPNFTAL